MPPSENLKIILHAPTANALARARSSAVNLGKYSPAPQVRIFLNGEAVGAALDKSHQADDVTLICPNTLRNIGRQAPAPFCVLEEPSMLVMARMQAEGWHYTRA